MGQIVDRFQQGNDREADDLLIVDCQGIGRSLSPEPQDGEQIAGGAGHADDMAAETIDAERADRLEQASEQVECLQGFGRELLDRDAHATLKRLH